MTASPRAALVLFLMLGTLCLAGGCVYRPTIQQGNLLKTEDVDQITAGMTRSQVRYVLGTPMISDPFNPQRWDYVYFLRRGRQSKEDRAHFVVWFEGDKVSRVEKPLLSYTQPTPPFPPPPPPHPPLPALDQRFQPLRGVLATCSRRLARGSARSGR
jgi:outer membrane protein assembly factor BamE